MHVESLNLFPSIGKYPSVHWGCVHSMQREKGKLALLLLSLKKPCWHGRHCPYTISDPERHSHVPGSHGEQ